MTRAHILAASLLVLAACGNRTERDGAGSRTPSPAPVATPAPSAASAVPSTASAAPATPSSDSSPAGAHRFESWAGRWTGPEGLFAQITPITAGHYRLEMRSDLDTLGTYDGRDDEHGIRFTRNGEALLLYRAAGNDTGLKWLAGRRVCLMVKPGEGYCRD